MEKLRTVITTDGEVDDMNSVLRYLLYSNDIETEGIVLTSSKYHYAGSKERNIKPFRWTGTDWYFEFIDSYEKVYPNLIKHDPSYPSPDFFRDNFHIGNIENEGDMAEETEGSNYLAELFLDDNPKTLYVQTWGGTNTTARALKSIEDKYSGTNEWQAIKKKIEDKLVIYIILDQDLTYAEYIAENWDLKIINDKFNFWHFAYAWKMGHQHLTRALSSEWNRDLKENFGPLLEKYALIGDGNVIEGELEEEQRGIQLYLDNNPQYEPYDFISEGDSPSFFYLLRNGLRTYEDPTYGGWGGRFVESKGQLYVNEALDWNPLTKKYESEYTLTRWFDDIQQDFKSRANWCVTDSFEEAAHYPEVQVVEGEDILVEPGDVITLNADANDPNGLPLKYNWWYYFEPSTYTKQYSLEADFIVIDGLEFSKKAEPTLDSFSHVRITGANAASAQVYIPFDIESGETIHIILEVENEAQHAFKTYSRIILTAK